MKFYRTSDGTEFGVFYEYFIPTSSFLKVESKDFLSVFDNGRLNHLKFLNFLKKLYSNEDWNGFSGLEWKLDEKLSNEDQKYYYEEKMELGLDNPLNISLYQGIGKKYKERRKNLVASCYTLIYAWKKPRVMGLTLPTGIVISTRVRINIPYSHRDLLFMVLGGWRDLNTPRSFYCFPRFIPVNEEKSILKEWYIHPGFPSKIDEFLSSVERVYDEELFSKIKNIEESIKLLKKAGESVEDLEKRLNELKLKLNHPKS